MKRKTTLALLALTAAAFPATADAAGPWTVANPQGITWTAPAGCTLVLDLFTSDGYPTRGDVTQLHELVVVYRNGVELGRTADLADRVPLAIATKRITAPVAAGDVVTVVHSSKAGLTDGTQNSVIVDATFTCNTAPTTPPTTFPPNLTPPLTTVVDPPAATIAPASPPTTSPVTVGEPPVVTATVPPETSPTTFISTPRPTPTTTVPLFVLPDTGTSDFLAALALIAATFCVLGAVTVWLNGGRR